MEKMKNIFLLAFLMLTSWNCLATSSKDDQLPQTTADHRPAQFIEDTFTNPRHTTIKNIFNSAFEKNDFQTLTSQFHLLDELKDLINLDGLFEKLFKTITTNLSITTGVPFLKKLVTAKTNLPPEIIAISRKFLNDKAPFHLTGSDQIQVDHLEYFETMLGETLTPADEYCLGLLYSHITPQHDKTNHYLEKIIQHNSPECTRDQKILAAFLLNHVHSTTSKKDYIPDLNLSSTDLAEWTRKNFYTIDSYHRNQVAYSIHKYVIDHCAEAANLENYLLRDIMFTMFTRSFVPFEPGKVVISPDVKQLLTSSTFKKFSPEDLKSGYLQLSDTYSNLDRTQELGFFALLCLQEAQPQDIDVLFRILEYHLKYLSYLHGTYFHGQSDQLLKQLQALYTSRHNVNTVEDSYRLAKVLFKIYKSKAHWAKLKGLQDNTLLPLLNRSQKEFINLSKLKLPPSLMADIAYYLSKISSHSNNIDNAKEYLGISDFWGEAKQIPRIIKLRKEIAKCAFSASVPNYAEPLEQYAKVEDELGNLNDEELVIKILCLNKLGYKLAVQNEMTKLHKDSVEDFSFYNWLARLFQQYHDNNDDEGICLLFEMTGRFGGIKRDAMAFAYLKAELNQHNYETICKTAETYIASSIENGLTCYPFFTYALFQTNQTELCSTHFKNYVDQARKFLIANETSESSFSKDNTPKEARIRFINHVLISTFHLLVDLKHPFYLDVIETLDCSSLPIGINSRILMFHIYRIYGKHKEAIACLLKNVIFDKNNIKFIPEGDLAPQDFNTAHTTFHTMLKDDMLGIFDSLLILNDEEKIHTLLKYYKSKHGITIEIKKHSPKKKHADKGNEKSLLQNKIYQHLINSFVKGSQANLMEAQDLVDVLNSLTPQEWAQFKEMTSEQILSDCNQALAITNKNLQIIQTLSKESPSSTINETARQAYENAAQATAKIKSMTSKIVYKVKEDRKKQKLQQQFEKEHDINETNFLNSQRSQGSVSRHVALRLEDLRQQQKEALVKERQRIRQEQRQALQQEYEKAKANDQVDHSEVPPETSLIACSVLPKKQDAYTAQHHLILWKILSHKFNLSDTDQETLRIILTRGERSFQITLKDITNLFSKFSGFTSDIHHGGSHEKVSGMGFTLMPNADGIKKGSYYAIIGEAREKIISNIAKTLTYKDMNDAS
jgi:NADH:ubiquinone oxidoreductase subunit